MLIKIPSSSRGSLLLEALLVIVILSIGLTFIIQSLSSSLRALAYSRSFDQAAFLIDNKFSEILLKNHLGQNVEDSGAFDSPFENFHFKTTTASVSLQSDAAASESLRQVNLTLNWPSGKNTQEITSSLLLFNPVKDEK